MANEREHLSNMAEAQGTPTTDGKVKCNYPGCEYEGTPRGLDAHWRVKHTDEAAEPEHDGEKSPENAKVVIYESRLPMLRTVRSSGSTMVVNAMGTPTRQQTFPAIKVPFKLTATGRGAFKLTEESARQCNSNFDELRELIENDSDFRNGLVWVAAADVTFVKSGVKVMQGARGTAS